MKPAVIAKICFFSGLLFLVFLVFFTGSVSDEIFPFEIIILPLFLFLVAFIFYYLLNPERKKEQRQRELDEEKIKEEIKLKNRFSCDVCGTIISENRCPNCNNIHDNQKKKGSAGWWYLLSILFGLIGGIIGYVALRHENPGAASNCLIIGVVITILSVIGAFLMGVL
jgi:Ca2+/Na+ antiporter